MTWAKQVSRQRAMSAVWTALRKGIIKRPRKCEACGATPRRRKATAYDLQRPHHPIEAHHADYNKPLEVQWLCRVCHCAWHAKNKPIEVAA